MAYDLTAPLVIGISSRALFNLEEENAVFEELGLKAYADYQREHEKDVLLPGPAFQLVRAFLNLNRLHGDDRKVEVIIMSRNSPETSLRIIHSIEHYGLDITRAALLSGADVAPYLKAFKTDLFLSAYAPDVKQAVDNGVAAGMILTGKQHANSCEEIGQIRVAFDGDAVIFSDESECRFKEEGMEAFYKYEKEHADEPLKEGPFAKLLMKLSAIQECFPTTIELSPLRLAIVTSRSLPSHFRVIKTLRKWGVYVDEAYFLGGLRKDELLKAFGAHIFFDDQDTHLSESSKYVPAGKVPYHSNSQINEVIKAKSDKKAAE